MKQYRKALIALIAVILTGVNAIYGTNSTVQLVISLAVAFGIYRVPNEPAI